MPRGYFVIADITGYTRYMTGTELDHAQGILSSLFEALLRQIKRPLHVSNFQGDAILCVAPLEPPWPGPLLIDVVEGLYIGFRAQVAHILLNTNCVCSACKRLPDLDLKVFVHVGDYATQVLAGREEISGPDVIAIHRMTKNSVVEKTAIKAYALYTAAAADAIGEPGYFAPHARHSESYEHLGDIAMVVVDLHKVWAHAEQTATAALAPDCALCGAPWQISLPVPPPLAWELLSAAQYPKWMLSINSVGRTATSRRMVAGETFHCHHGDNVTATTMIEARPFERIVRDSAMPLGGTMREQWTLVARDDGGTDVTAIFAMPTAPKLWQQCVLWLIGKLMVGPHINKIWVQAKPKLLALATDMQAQHALAPAASGNSKELAAVALSVRDTPAQV